MNATHRPIIVPKAAPGADQLTWKLAQASYLTRRRFLQLQLKWPSRFMYKFRNLRRTDPRGATDPVYTAQSVDELRTLLVESLLWLSSPEQFNDPFDSWAEWTLAGSAEERLARFTELAAQHVPNPADRPAAVQSAMHRPKAELIAELRRSFARQRRTMGVCCFVAGDPRNVLMWSHYASSHGGICVQFEVARSPQDLMRAVHVDYKEDCPVINWVTGTEMRKLLGVTMLRKHPRWAYEREHRILCDSSADRYICFDPAAITAIIFGCKADADTKSAVQGLLGERAALGLPPVKLYYARQHDAAYELQIWGTETGRAAKWTGRAPLPT